MSHAARPVLFFANGFGDCLLNLPAIRAVAYHFRGRLRLVTQPDVRSAFLRDVPLADAIEVPMTRADGGRRFDVDRVADRLGACDLFLSLVPWHSASLDRLLERLRPSQSVGFFDAYKTVLPLDYTKHSSELAFDVARSIDPRARIEAFSGPPRLSPRARHAARQVRRIVPAGSRLLVVHDETLPQKMWPVERLRRTLSTCLARHRDLYVLTLSTKSQELDRCRHGDRVIPIRPVLREIAVGLTGAADLFLGVDSALLHAADLFRVSSVALFGPTNPAEFGVRFARHLHLHAPEGMSAITESQVLDALEGLLKQAGTTRADGENPTCA